MASSQNYIENSKDELNFPDHFLPIHMVFIGTHPTWTKPTYAAFNNTKTPADFTFTHPNALAPVPLPQHMDTNKSAPFAQGYIHEFIHASANISEWCRGQSEKDIIFFTKHHEQWIKTCDILLSNPNFAPDWNLPSFLPWYHMDLSISTSQYFKTLKQVLPGPNSKNEEREAWKIIEKWECVAFHHFYNECSPFPKCLWYHKFKREQATRNANRTKYSSHDERKPI